jgi:hypothetical protein
MKVKKVKNMIKHPRKVEGNQWKASQISSSNIKKGKEVTLRREGK